MDKILIKGGAQLKGAIEISGSKNATLPLMASSILTDEIITIKGAPNLTDVKTLIKLLEELGGNINFNKNVISIQFEKIKETKAPYDLVRKMRASILVAGPLLARCGEVSFSLPGGCAIGARPIDIHLSGLKKMGANILLEDGYIRLSAPKGLSGASITLPTVSVGATENLVMAATLARGETIIANAAKEPEVCDLMKCLVGMGASIEGIGTEEIRITGVKKLRGTVHEVIPDRIETGTFLIASALTSGDIEIFGAEYSHNKLIIDVLRKLGIKIEFENNKLIVQGSINGLRSCSIATKPYPGFPTDLQAQMMALLTLADGESFIIEEIFENRFMHVAELNRMGANITISGSKAKILGVRGLLGAPVMATDLRASVSLVLAGLAAKGETIVNRVYHLDRGYESLDKKLIKCGATISRI